jgi:hypothetical protein
MVERFRFDSRFFRYIFLTEGVVGCVGSTPGCLVVVVVHSRAHRRRCHRRRVCSCARRRCCRPQLAHICAGVSPSAVGVVGRHRSPLVARLHWRQRVACTCCCPALHMPVHLHMVHGGMEGAPGCAVGPLLTLVAWRAVATAGWPHMCVNIVSHISAQRWGLGGPHVSSRVVAHCRTVVAAGWHTCIVNLPCACTEFASSTRARRWGILCPSGQAVGYTAGGGIGCGCGCNCCGGSIALLWHAFLSPTLPITGLPVVPWLQAIHGPTA